MSSALEEEEIYENVGDFDEKSDLETTIHSLLETPEGEDEIHKFTQNLGPISRKYIKKIFINEPGHIDHTYGPYFNGDKLMI